MTEINSIKHKLKKQNIRFIRYIWTDNAGLIRSKAVHVRFIQDYLQSGVGIAKAQQAVPIMFDAPSPNSGLTPVGEVYLKPDWSTLTSLPYAPGHARVFTDIYEGKASWTHCPTTFLVRIIKEAKRI